MTKQEANAVLNAAKAGHVVSLIEITRALWVTGDLVGNFSKETK